MSHLSNKKKRKIFLRLTEYENLSLPEIGCSFEKKIKQPQILVSSYLALPSRYNSRHRSSSLQIFITSLILLSCGSSFPSLSRALSSGSISYSCTYPGTFVAIIVILLLSSFPFGLRNLLEFFLLRLIRFSLSSLRHFTALFKL